MNVRLPGGSDVPRFGLGTWRMGERRAERAAELAALRAGLDADVRLIDTAEMYGAGGAEEVVGEAVRGRRDEVFIVSKVYPHNASERGAVAACERSLKRLATDRIDLYLLHWKGEYPLSETVAAFERLCAAGKIRYWGVSNLDLEEMIELDGTACQTNQLYYNLAHRGIEVALLPWQRERGITTMAYSPLDQARLLGNAKLAAIAKPLGVTPAQLALAWLLRMPDVITIPKATRPAHLREILVAREIALEETTVRALEAAFPVPKKRGPLETT